jgi:hypothetical protein
MKEGVPTVRNRPCPCVPETDQACPTYCFSVGRDDRCQRLSTLRESEQESTNERRTTNDTLVLRLETDHSSFISTLNG